VFVGAVIKFGKCLQCDYRLHRFAMLMRIAVIGHGTTQGFTLVVILRLFVIVCGIIRGLFILRVRGLAVRCVMSVMPKTVCGSKKPKSRESILGLSQGHVE
jgi:hypothetical protein